MPFVPFPTWSAGFVVLLPSDYVALRRAAPARSTTSRRTDVKSLVERALSLATCALGVPRPPLHFPDALENAQANRHGIWVDLDWAGRVLDSLCVEDSRREHLALAIVAHELAHNVDPWLDEPTVTSWRKELFADWVAGAVLAMAGASLSEFVAFVERTSRLPTPTHPDATQRVSALASGWAHAAPATRGRAVQHVC